MSWQTYIATGAATASLEREINKSGILLAISLSDTLGNADPSQLASNLEKLIRSPGASQVLNVVAWESGQAIVTARGESMITWSTRQPIEDPAAQAAGVKIHEFTHGGIPVRSFSVSLTVPPPPGSTGKAIERRLDVLVSAAEIQTSRRRLIASMVGATATACAVAAVGAFLLVGFLTAPIRALVRDMKQVSLGKLEHKSEVASSDELGDLARAFNAMTAGLQAAQEAKLTQRALEQELSLASRIQEKLLPATTPSLPGFDLALHYTPAREVGGDYYDFLLLDEENVGIVVADVSGKGVPASLVMTMTRSLLRIAARGERSPARAIELVNRFLTPDLNTGMFVTLVYFVLHVRKRELTLVRAGHNPPLLYRAGEQKLLQLKPKGIAVGLDRKGSLFLDQLKVERTPLEAGDVIVLYSDGVVEAKDPDGQDYSDERFARVVTAHAGDSAQDLLAAVLDDVEKHRGGSEQSDDLTLVVLKALPE